ncbi:N-6 DNA methylase [Alteromonas stellipolaris]|uniref:N-6 DNA methylase n=1 Tax=Alteromonas stellipolaris TaxID=233316 RepID=UPI001DDC60AD|nr:N-6 DNA methylase [Alteromonas stellipolaris]MBZ2164167.1 N-6 DNA methylase [Alteromonas stellipolaris]
MKKTKNAIIQITGYNKDKGSIYGLLKGKPEKPITLVFSRHSKARNFIDAFIDESAKSHAPIGSFIHARNLRKLVEDGEFYAATSANLLSKPSQPNKAVVAPIKVDAEFTKLTNKGTQKTYDVLFASVLDEEYESIRKLSELENAMLRALDKESQFGERAKRGALIRVGYTKASGEKHTIPIEFVAPRQNGVEAAVKEFVRNSKELKNALNTAKDALQSPQGILEVAGYSRVIINDFGNKQRNERHRNNTAYVEDSKRSRRAYTLAALSFSPKYGNINEIHVFDTKENSVAGTVGVHGHDTSAFYNIEYRTEAQQQEINHQFRYPLRFGNHLNSTGKITGVKVSGDESKLKQFEDRIMKAVEGITPIKTANKPEYVFPKQHRQQVLSSLSDLLGTPAIYSETTPIDSVRNDKFRVSGHTDVAPFSDKLKALTEKYQGEVLSGDFYFPLDKRLDVESDLADLLNQPLKQAYTGPSKAPRLSYAEWLDDKYNGNTHHMMQDLDREISDVADQMGIDWSKTQPNIIMPPPGSNMVQFKGSKTVWTSNTKHAGSAQIIASSGYLASENKAKGKTEDLLTITLKFYNKKIDSGAGEISFNSFHALLDKYNLDMGRGYSQKNAEQKEKQRLERESNLKRQKERLEAKRIADAKKVESDVKDAQRMWETAPKETGNNPQLIKKKLSEATGLCDVRRLDGRNPAFMYAIYDMKDNFGGLQKIYGTPWQDDKGRSMNKVFSASIPLSDPITGEKTGAHGRIGHDDGKSTIYVGEGFNNTLTAVYLAGGYGVVGLNKDNVKHVISMLRNKYPERPIVQIADNDWENSLGNVGLLSAIEASWDSKVGYVLPSFGENPEKGLNDLSDLYVTQGASEAKRQLSDVIAPPSTLLEYHTLIVRHSGDKDLQARIDTAILALESEYDEDDIKAFAPNGIEAYLAEQRLNGAAQKVVLAKPQTIEAAPKLSTVTPPAKAQPVVKDMVTTPAQKPPVKPIPEVKTSPTQKPAETVPTNVTQSPPLTGIDFIEKVTAKTNTAYLLLVDHEGKHHDKIKSASARLAQGRAPIFNPKLKGFIIPFAQKNPLAAALHELTGAPQLYFGMPYDKSATGFVIRGDLTDAVRNTVQKSLGQIPFRYDANEHGIVVEDETAINLLKPALKHQLHSQNSPVYFNPTAPRTSDVLLNEMQGVSQQLNVPVSHIKKANALIKSFDINMPSDQYWLAAFYAKNAPKFQHLNGLEKHQAILKESIEDAFINNGHFFEDDNDLIARAAAFAHVAKQLDMLSDQNIEPEVKAQEVPVKKDSSELPATSKEEEQATEEVIQEIVAPEVKEAPASVTYMTPPTKPTAPTPVLVDSNEQVSLLNTEADIAPAAAVAFLESETPLTPETEIATPEVQTVAALEEPELEQNDDIEAVEAQPAVIESVTEQDLVDRNAIEHVDSETLTALNEETDLFDVDDVLSDFAEFEPSIGIDDLDSDKASEEQAPIEVELESTPVSADSEAEEEITDFFDLEPSLELSDIATSENDDAAKQASEGSLETPPDNITGEAIEFNTSSEPASLNDAGNEDSINAELPSAQLTGDALEPNDLVTPPTDTFSELHINEVNPDAVSTESETDQSLEGEIRPTESDTVTPETEVEVVETEVEEGITEDALIDFMFQDLFPDTQDVEEVVQEADTMESTPLQPEVTETTAPEVEGETVAIDDAVPAIETDAAQRYMSLIEYMNTMADNGFTPDEFESDCIEIPGMPYFSIETKEVDIQQFNADVMAMRHSLNANAPKTFIDTYVGEYIKAAKGRMDTAETYTKAFLLIKGEMEDKRFREYFRGANKLKGHESGHAYIEDGKYNKALFESDLDYVHGTTVLSQFYRQMAAQVFGSKKDEGKQLLEKVINEANEQSENTQYLRVLSNEILVLSVTQVGDSLTVKGQALTDKELEKLSDLPTQLREESEVDTLRSEDSAQLLKCKFPRYGDIYLIGNNGSYTASEDYTYASARFSSMLPKVEEVAPATDSQVAPTPSTPSSTSEASKLVNAIEKPLQDNRFAELKELLTSAVESEMTYEEFHQMYLSKEALDVSPYHDPSGTMIDSEAIRNDLKKNSYTSVRALYNTLKKELNLDSQIRNDEIVSVAGINPSQKDKLSTAISSFDLLPRLAVDSSSIMPFAQFINTPSALGPINEIQAISYRELTSKEAIDKYSLAQFKLFAEINQVKGSESVEDKAALATIIQENLTHRSTIALLDEGSLSALPPEELAQMAAALRIESTSSPVVTARKLRQEAKSLHDSSIVKVAQLNFVATIAHAQDAGLPISGRILREVDAFTGGELESVATRVEEINARQDREAFINTLASGLQSVSLLDFDTRVDIRADEYENPIVVGIENPKYVSKGRFHYAVLGDTKKAHEGLLLPSDVSYFTVLSDRSIGVARAIENEYLSTYSLAPLNKNAVEFSLDAIDRYLSDAGLIGANNDEGESLIIAKQKDQFTCYQPGADEPVAIYNSLSELSDAVLSQGLTYFSVDSITNDFGIKQTLSIHETLALVESFNEQNIDEVVEILGEQSATKGLFANEKVNFVKENLLSTLLGDYKQALINNDIAERPAWFSQVEATITAKATATATVETSTPSKPASQQTLMVGDRIVTQDGSVKGRIILLAENEASVVPEWLYQARNEGSKLLSSLPLSFFENVNANAFSETVPLSDLNVDVFEKYSPANEDGLENLKNAPDADITTLAILFGLEKSEKPDALKQQIEREFDLRMIALEHLSGLVDEDTTLNKMAAAGVNLKDSDAVTEWFTDAKKLTAKQLYAFRYVNLLKECERFGMTQKVGLVHQLDSKQLDNLHIVRPYDAETIISVESKDYTYWRDTIQLDEDHPLSIAFLDGDVIVTPVQPAIEVVEAKRIDEGTPLLTDNKGQVEVVTVQGYGDNDTLQVMTDEGQTLNLTSEFVEYDEAAFESIKNNLGLNEDGAFITILEKALQKAEQLAFPESGYAQLAIAELESVMDLRLGEGHLSQNDLNLGISENTPAYFDKNGKLIGTGETIEKAILATQPDKEQNDEISGVSARDNNATGGNALRTGDTIRAVESNGSRDESSLSKNGGAVRNEPTNLRAEDTEGRRPDGHSDTLESPTRREGTSTTSVIDELDGRIRSTPFDFTQQSALSTFSLKEKYQHNIDAIKIVKELEKSERKATQAEVDALGKYSGWGGIAKFLSHWEYSKQQQELEELVTPQEYAAIKSSTNTAFFTPVPVTQTVWKGLHKMGFKGGKVYDPSMGTGNFYGLMPASLAEKSSLSGVELDSITAAIAKHLQPDVKITNTGYEKVVLPNDYFDVITSNIPFGNFKLHEPDYNHLNLSIHDHFIAKSLDKLKPGGMVAFITSTYTMDSRSTKAREHFAQSSDLVSAMRLPNKVFKEHAGTEANADILFFRKRFDHEKQGNTSWVNTDYFDKLNYGEIFINNYFLENPDRVIGDLIVTSSQFGKELGTSFTGDIQRELDAQVAKLPANQFTPNEPISTVEAKPEPKQSPDIEALLQPHHRVGSLMVVDDDIYCLQREWDSEQEAYRLAPQAFEYRESNKERLMSLIELRDATRMHIAIQVAKCSDEEFESSATKLNNIYDSFVKRFKDVSATYNKSVFKSDPDAMLICALESKAPNTGKTVKANTFTQRTIQANPPQPVIRSEDDAFLVSLSRFGSLNPDYIERATGKSMETLYNEHDSLFIEPQSQSYVHASQYLSGDMADKLKHAKAAFELGEDYATKNINAIEKAWPTPINFGDIRFKIGSQWMPHSYIKDFVYYLGTGNDPRDDNDVKDIHVGKVANLWDINARYSFTRKNEAKLENEWGTSEMSALTLINKLANGDKIEVAVTIDGKRTVLAEETAKAKHMADTIQTEFKAWVGKDPERRIAIAEIYNSTVNVINMPQFNGSLIQYTGLNPKFKGNDFEPREKQKDALARYLVDKSVLFAHGVGSGKSFELVSCAREGRIAGVHNKAMIAAPNNVYGQLARMFQEHYPSANILMMDSKELSALGRKEVTARIAMNNYDAVIVPHSFLNKLAAPSEFVIGQLERQKGELSHAISIAEGIGGYNLKRSEKRLKSLEAKIERRLKQENKDDMLYINELGIDALFIDESDNFLNLPTPSNMSHVAGVNTSESDKATNLLFMVRYLQEQNNGNGLVLATGTDIRKSMSDMYTNLYYLIPNELERMGILDFDSFMSTFGEVVTAIEASPEGTGYRENSRLAKFNNLPELAKLYRVAADVLTTDESGAQRPHAVRIPVQADGGEFFKPFMNDIALRAKSFRNGSKDEAWFSIQHDAQKAAFDLRMIDARLPAAENGKINTCVRNIESVLKNANTDMPVTQLVFIDRYVNPTSQGFSPYDELINQLVDKGVCKREEIITSREVDTENKKKAFEAAANEGKFKVIIGTTERFGVGNNIQTYLKAMHELTPPWNPREIEQRSGRIERTGNKHTDLSMFRYSTENSYDLFQWEHIRRKALFIAQTKTDPNSAPREYLEEVDANFEEMMAIATGNPLIKEKIDLDRKVDELERARRITQDKQADAISRINMAKKEIRHADKVIDFIDKTLAVTAKNSDNIDLNGAFVDDADTILKALKKARDVAVKSNEDFIEVGTYKGLPISIDIIYQKEKEMPILNAMINVDGVERSFCETKHISHVARTLMDIETTFAEVKEKSIKEKEDLDKRIGTYEPLTVISFDREDELKSSLKRQAELQAELVEVANEQKEEEVADWKEILNGHIGSSETKDFGDLSESMSLDD